MRLQSPTRTLCPTPLLQNSTGAPPFAVAGPLNTSCSSSSTSPPALRIPRRPCEPTATQQGQGEEADGPTPRNTS